MARKVFIADTNCVTPLGFDVASNAAALEAGISGIRQYEREDLLNIPFYAAIIQNEILDAAFAKITPQSNFTRLEKMMILALHPVVDDALSQRDRTGFIVSTTKGNVTALNDPDGIQNAQLSRFAEKISHFFGFQNEPIIISNACVSGILAVSVAKRLIQSGRYDHVYVAAGDEVSEFVLSGFNSFQAMSDAPCKPYSINRSGVSLGEAAAAVLVTSDASKAKVRVLGDGSINDANHISGPSRTGEGLFLSIKSAMDEAEVDASSIGYISAHGTATPFNDEMEAIAFNRHAMSHIPVNSLKGFYGHTLGASGLLETVMAIESGQKGKLFTSLGFDELGVSVPMNIIRNTQNSKAKIFLKTASGFGGCNTAVLFETL